ncbi:MAG: histidine kinase dimerization/phospho-acceptor domain-containing protein, partial [Halanaerobacter sp.]
MKFNDNVLFNRLLFRFLAIILIIVIISGLAITYFVKNFYFKEKTREIINESRVLARSLAQSLAKNDLKTTQKWIKLIAELNSGHAWLVTNNGYVILSDPSSSISKEEQITSFEVEKVLKGYTISKRVESPRFEETMMLVGLPMNYSGSDQVEAGLLIFSSVSGIKSTITQIQKIMAYSLLLAIILALIISYTWAKDLSGKLKEMSQTALQMSEGNFDKRINIDDDSEIGILSDSMNYLAKKLKGTIDDLTQERNKLKHVLTGIEEGVLLVDNQEEIILSNQSFQKLFGLDADLNEQDLTTVINNQTVITNYRKVLESGEVEYFEFTLHDNGLERRILVNYAPIYLDNNQLWAVVALFNDISERWRFEKLQQNFVANVSHELKSPLSSIKGSTEVLADGVVQDEARQKEYLDIILEETERLSNMVEEILDLAELNTEDNNLNLTEVNLKEFLVEIKNIFTKQFAEQDRIDLELLDTDFNYCLDKEKIKQVLLNLLDNAAKYSPEDSLITIGVAEERESIKFWVSDQGSGIPQDEIQDIWKRFYKVDKARTP